MGNFEERSILNTVTNFVRNFLMFKAPNMAAERVLGFMSESLAEGICIIGICIIWTDTYHELVLFTRL
jgi:hypothetical protein